jgi:hypothetical protein
VQVACILAVKVADPPWQTGGTESMLRQPGCPKELKNRKERIDKKSRCIFITRVLGEKYNAYIEIRDTKINVRLHILTNVLQS